MKLWNILIIITILFGKVVFAQIPETTFSDDDYFLLKNLSPDISLDSAKALIEAEKEKISELEKQNIKTEKIDTTLTENQEKPLNRDSLAFEKFKNLQKPQNEADLKNMSHEDLFLAAFKKERVRAHYFVAYLYADGNDFGKTEISYDSAFTSFNFYSIPFSDYLDTILLADERPRINGMNGFFNSEKLKDLGFEIELNESLYELHIGLPADVKELQRMDFNKTTPPKGALVKPAYFSFYSNFYINVPYNCSDGCLRDPFYADANAAMALFGWIVAEGSGTFTEYRDKDLKLSEFKRGDLRLIKDIYSLDSRLTIGDVGEFGGIRYEHSNGMFSRYRVDDKHKINFFLPRGSYVEIHIDGKLYRRLYLPSGYHEISGFPGNTGVNTVQVFVPGIDGRLQEIKHEFVLGDSRILPLNNSQYHISAGFMRTGIDSPASYKYHTDEPGLTVGYTYGLFKYLSAGFSWQLSKHNIVASTHLRNTNLLGYTELKGTINRADSSSLGERADLSHIFTINEYFNFSTSGYFQSTSYNPGLFSSRGYASAEFAGVSGSIGTSFSQTYLSLFGGASFNRNSEISGAVNYNCGAAFSKDVFGFFINAGASYSISKYSNTNSFYLNVAYNFATNGHNVSINNRLHGYSNEIPALHVENPNYNPYAFNEIDENNEDSEYIEIPEKIDHNIQRSHALNWNWSRGGSNTGGQRYSVNVNASENIAASEDIKRSNMGANFGAGYYFNRANINARYRFSRYDGSYGKGQSHKISANASASFMFADGLWAFGRPVSGGFILADVNKSLDGATVIINRSGNRYFSSSGILGSAYQNRLTNYGISSINISIIDMPPGAWLEQNQYYVTGAYKQGYALKLGNDMRVLMQTTLKDERGALNNIYVAIFKIDENGKITEKRITFTSKEGVLQMGNLIPGEKYRLTFDPSTYIKSVDIEIPSDSEPFMEIPNIKVERE